MTAECRNCLGASAPPMPLGLVCECGCYCAEIATTAVVDGDVTIPVTARLVVCCAAHRPTQPKGTDNATTS